MKAELPVNDMKILNKKIIDEERHTAYMSARTILLTFRGQYTPHKLRLFYKQLQVHIYKPRLLTCHKSKRYGHTHQNSVEVQPFKKDADITTKQKIAKHRSHTATTMEENTEQMTQPALKEMYKYNEIHRNTQ
jgi:hypothetical protein